MRRADLMEWWGKKLTGMGLRKAERREIGGSR